MQETLPAFRVRSTGERKSDGVIKYRQGIVADEQRLTQREIFNFWFPLALTWVMMSVEGPFLAAAIARLPEPKFNLAAYGVAFSLALIVEAPIIMIMSAATALVKDRMAFLKLRRFTSILNWGITLSMLVLLIPPVFTGFAEGLIELPHNVASLAYTATALLLPWPAAIGFRRFYQGILIRNNLTRLVAVGTVIRLGGMALTAFLLWGRENIDGVAVGAASLSVGVVLEAIAARWMAAASVRALLAEKESESSSLTYRSIITFYYPLALTSMIGLGVQPVITFFVGQSRLAIESLAVLPVVTSMVFIFRSGGMAWQEVGIALLGDRLEHYPELRRFAFIMGSLSTLLLALFLFTPLSSLWFHELSGLSDELTEIALLPAQILVLFPALMVLLSFQRSVLVVTGATAPITWATIIEVITIVGALFVAISYMDLAGAVAVSVALMIGRIVAISYLSKKV